MRPLIVAFASFRTGINSGISTINSRTTSVRTTLLIRRMVPNGIDCRCRVPGCRLYWSLTADQINVKTDELIDKCKAVYDAVGKLSETPEVISVANVVKVLADIDCESSTEGNMLDFFQHVSPHKDLREASTESTRKMSAFEVEMSMRVDVFRALKALDQKEEEKSKLSPEGRRYLARLIRNGKRNGLDLSENVQEELKNIKKKMSDLSIDFSKNLNEDTTSFEFTRDELAGCPDDFLNSLEKGEAGKLKVTLKYPHYFPVMGKCRVPATRAKMEKAFNSRCLKENTLLLEDTIVLREKQAQLLGYPTHADYVLEMRMAKNPQAVAKFLKDLNGKLQALKAEEFKTYLKYKAEEAAKYNFEDDGKINPFDMRYYMKMAEERLYSVDHQKLKEYFPMDKVTKGLLEIYQTILNLKFALVPDANVWHEDVTMYSVKDADDDRLLGHFYLDLYPRDGKFGHAAVFPLQPGCINPEGKRQTCVTAMVANFTKPTEGKPALLLHDEVETYFHEFGHVMHQICAQAEYAFFAGTKVERDFVEAPSQMLENWCWEKEPLALMSGHYKDGSAIPEDMVDKLVASHKANAGIFNLRQIMLGTFDQKIHSGAARGGAAVDTAAIFSQLGSEIMSIPATPDTNMAASFGHLLGGYDAQYYGYMWSEVFCMDMFYSRFKSEGVMNPAVGKDYRKCILQPGGSIDAADMLVNFLGREPNSDAFLLSKGLAK